MKNKSPKLFIIINDEEIVFTVGNIDENGDYNLLEKLIVPSNGLNNNEISDLEKITNLFKKNIMQIEQKIRFTFKDLIIILDNFETSFTNLTGYKKLNGTQISKENITYILNSLKSVVEEFEENKKILHIFNSEYHLDKKKIYNLPIGLFGNFYSHSLSFNLLDKNDYKNLITTFDKSNLKIKKILLDSFVKGSFISNKFSEIDTFFHIQINKKNSKIFNIENDSLRYEQKFKFGTDIILNDISKITSFKFEIIKEIIEDNSNINNFTDTQFLEQKYFKDMQYRKIKKKLISDISEARIKEISEIIYRKNINVKNHSNKKKVVFIEIEDKKLLKCFNEIFIKYFSANDVIKARILDKPDFSEIITTANNIAQYGWIKEAIPVTKRPESLISRIFRAVFE